jgi:amidohydrolase
MTLPPSLINKVREVTEKQYDHVFDLFQTYNKNPEIGMKTYKTSKRQAEELKSAGYEVIELVETGVVGILRNGKGPTYLFRADCDALPVSDERGEVWASQIEGKGHQCGHSIHASNLIGIARTMVQLKSEWSGTLVLVSQPGEEFDDGGQLMINAGLFNHFDLPKAALAYHCSPTLAGGTVGLVRGPAMALVEMPKIIVRGIGGHGGYPQTTKDAVVLASSIVMRLQTIVSRLMSPFEPCVVSVCSINGGASHNVLPDSVELKLTVRCFKTSVYQKILAEIKTICNGEAMAAGLPPELYPIVTERGFITKAVVNDIPLADKLEGIFTDVLGKYNVRQEPCYTFGEDFSSYGLDGKVPLGFVWLGSVNPNKFDTALQPKPTEKYPPLHNPKFNPHPPTTIRTGVWAMSAALMALYKNG